jgi:ubiquinone/menaquinone biosynthesis C-methylase UbiE
MPDHKSVYTDQAQQYERLVSREDYQGNILPALQAIRPLANSTVLELGAGTGRLTRLLAPLVTQIIAFDLSPAMLAVAATRLKAMGQPNWQVTVADHRHLPAAANSADLMIAGWSVCYLVTWYEQTWRQELDRAMAGMAKALRPGGTIIFLETLGTDHTTPAPPLPLQPYYNYLAENGFQSTWIRTDYQFESVTEAEELVRFFFGDEMANEMRQQQQIILPECTGIWWRHKPASGAGINRRLAPA